MDWKKIKNKIIATLGTVAGIIIAIWIISPIPEISIIFGLFGGETLTQFIPRWVAYLISFTGALAGYFIFRKLGLIEKFMNLISGNKSEDEEN